jgi:chemotaxis protein methyltransferase CheR
MFSNELSDKHFRQFSRLVGENCGINLQACKKELVHARLCKRLRATGCGDFNAYIKFLKEDVEGKELLHFLDAISSHETPFFRDPTQFEFLKTVVFPALQAGGPKRFAVLERRMLQRGRAVFPGDMLQEHFSRHRILGY